MSGEPTALAPARMFFREAIARAAHEAMQADPRVIIIGQDVGTFGGSYKEFAGLYDAFGPERVRDTPIAESAMMGVAVGAAAAGLRPLVSITYMDFLMLGLDPLVNYGVKARFKTGGQLSVPLVIKTTAGAKGQGVAHSQCIEAWMMSVPGLRVFAPSTPADAYLMLKAAFSADGPILFVDHKRLFPLAGDVPPAGTSADVGRAAILLAGDDITLVAHSYMCRVALAAADRLGQIGIAAEVIDLRCLSPLDITTIEASVSRTRRLITIEEGQKICGVGSEIIAQLSGLPLFFNCDRVAALPVPISSNPVLEAAALPDPDRVVAAARALMTKPPHKEYS